MQGSFTIYLSPFTVRYLFTVHRAGVVFHGKRFMVNAWKMVNSERLIVAGGSL